jgi:hypothetical protein
MTDETFYPLTIKNIEQAIVNKAKERNEEMRSEFYSYDAEQYEFVAINTYPDYKLILFRCPKSKSTVSIKIKD